MKSFPFVIILVFLLAACNGTPETTPKNLQTVSIQLSWINEYSSAQFHVAVHEGYFAAEGLEATILEGGFQDGTFIDSIEQVASGQAQFGTSSSAALIQANAEGKPLVAVANFLQMNPVGIITLDSAIQSPQDLVGRRILVADGGARHNLEIFLTKQNISLEAVTMIPRTDFGVEPLVDGEVDALVAWVINEGVSLQEQGLTPTYFLFSDYGIEDYTSLLFTTQSLIEEQPELVQKVVNALHLGLDMVVNDPFHSVDDVLSFAPSLDRDAQLRRLEASIPLMKIEGIHDTSMDPVVWDYSFNLLAERGLVPANLDIETVYTLQFAEASNDLEN